MPAGSSGRPRFLASVMSAPEALTALAAGAEIIDGKNPAAGALGALPHATVRAIVEAVGHVVPVSATIGDLPAIPDVLSDAATAMAATGIDLVKIGFFDGGDAKASIAALGRLDLGQARLVGLLLADRNPDLNLVAAMADAGFAGVMLDTATKDGRALPDVMSTAEISRFVD
ncbi:MAG: (5-formylfuran-3-yl)methyl phosphate synthase, partial [Hyphomicrobium sp.]